MLELDTETTLPSSRLHLNHIAREGVGEALGEKVDVEIIEVAKPAKKNDSRVKQIRTRRCYSSSNYSMKGWLP